MSLFFRLDSLLLPSFITTCEALNIAPPKVHITITNDLKTAMPVTIHCSSHTDDFGVHSVFNLADIQFDFQPIPLLSKDVNCSMEWGGQIHHYFDVYINKRDKDRGNICCSWFLREVGLFCFLVRLVLYVIHGSNVKINLHPSSSISL